MVEIISKLCFTGIRYHLKTSRVVKYHRRTSFLVFNKRCMSTELAHETFTATNLQSSATKYYRDDYLIETEYYFENGLRKVYPYYFQYSTFCKGRWLNRKLIDVYSEEFPIYPRKEFERRISEGVLKVNGKSVDLDYILRDGDHLTACGHRHELGVLASPVNIIYENEDFLIVNKPSSIPVHPCGLYRHNTILFILAKEKNRKNLHVAHRLDRLSSGVLILAKSSKKSRELHDQLNLHDVKKEYVCRVEGNFPDGILICNKPLKKINHKLGISIVDPSGKVSVTEFKKLSFNGKSSVVCCRPLTGRTHQIRVHLQYLGYPIVNDPLYNSYAFGPAKGKHGIFHKTIKELLEDLAEEHTSEWWLESSYANIDEAYETGKSEMNFRQQMQFAMIDKELVESKYKKDDAKVSFDKNCYFCCRSYRDPKPINLIMFLHSLKYQARDWEFRTEMPTWASEEWNLM
ncbi:RNA pseudouridylate synthase domain-containing protein 2-like [Stegodyphus dumicola]|uniref:RNA pseudouridylate synthase domain-containing protein 2-like n=1 Tax=Stegodyphus dumicola TaxID=202533 RepID=UPI0015AD57BE|nr:RNA pseudouridylate synthase domain-containing protein 2-like [Stegodyphus dumicola]